MALFQRLIWGALAVAFGVGSVQTVLQQWQAAPIIMAAEAFEARKAAPSGAEGHDHAHEHAHDPVHDHAHEHVHDHAHTHDSTEAVAEWSPADGTERTTWTWVANVLHAFSLALLVFAVMGLWVWRRGASLPPLRLAMLVAGAGWLSLHLWPSLGLPAEVPGMDAAGLGARQAWWVLAAASAAMACASAAWLRTPWRWFAVVAWLAVPHVLGAPHVSDPLAAFGAEVRDQMQHLNDRFLWVTALLSLTLWAGLGVGCGLVFARWVQPSLKVAVPATAMASAG